METGEGIVVFFSWRTHRFALKTHTWIRASSRPCWRLCTWVPGARGEFGRFRFGWDQLGVGSECQPGAESNRLGSRFHDLAPAAIIRRVPLCGLPGTITISN